MLAPTTFLQDVQTRLDASGVRTAIALGHGWVVVIQLLTFLGKVFLLCSFQILIRWTLPRFRWDQLLSFAWRFLLPLSIANLVVTAVAVWALG